MTKKLYAASLGVAFAATLGAVALPAHADATDKVATSGQRLVYVPHKSGYPFNFFYVPNERAEFARVEIDPANRPKRILPSPKSGHPFLTRD